MKTRIIFILLIAAVLLLVGCQEWERNYDNINDEFARIISMHFIEPNVAPGDTVTIRSVWSGQRITASDLKWDVSWKVFSDLYGEETVLDIESLEPYIVTAAHEVSRNDVTQVFEMEIEIPENIIYDYPGISETWTDILEPYGLSIDVDDYDVSSNKDTLLMMLDSLVKLSDADKALIPFEEGLLLNGICQFAGATFKIFCDYTAAGGFKGGINHNVGYHSKLEAIPGMYMNNRPVQSGWRIHEVEGDPTTFYPGDEVAAQVFEIISDSVAFEFKPNYSYFLECDISERDSTITSNSAFTDQTPSLEQFYGYWFYDDDAYKSIDMTQQEDQTDQYEGRARMVYKLKIKANPVKNKALHFWFENLDYKQAAGKVPMARDLGELDITLL